MLDTNHIYWNDGANIGRANFDGSGVDYSFIDDAYVGPSDYWAMAVETEPMDIFEPNPFIFWGSACGISTALGPGPLLGCAAVADVELCRVPLDTAPPVLSRHSLDWSLLMVPSAFRVHFCAGVPSQMETWTGVPARLQSHDLAMLGSRM